MKALRLLASCLSATQRASLREWIPPALARRLRAGAVEGSAEHGRLADSRASRAAVLMPRTIADMLFVLEVDGAEMLVGDLFKRRFNTNDFPRRPRHFVGFYRGLDNVLLPIGYVHHDLWNQNSLCGGLVIDERLYRRIPAADRAIIHAAGGIAEAMLRGSFALLEEGLIAIWAHVGNKQSEKVCQRVGYRRTDAEYVMVIWLKSGLSDAEKADWVRQVNAYGPF